MTLKFIDLFAGIGGFHQAFKGLAECVFASEIDKFARQTYEANHDMVPHGDITKIEAKDIPAHDILCAGFPCQSFSIAGKRKGFEDTRGTMFFEIARIVEYHKPKVVFLENVKGLRNHEKGKTLTTILSTLDDLGYENHWQILNAKDYGVPQNRERIFMVAIRKDIKKEFSFPDKTPLTKTLSDILETKVDKDIAYTVRASGRSSGVGNKHNWDMYTLCDTRNGANTLHSWDIVETTEREKIICMTILKNRRKKRYGNKDGNPISFYELKEIIPDLEVSEIWPLCDKNILRGLDEGIVLVNSKNSAGINGIYRIINETGIFPTLTATQGNDYICDNFTLSDKLWANPRRLTPRECARLQGFPDSFVIPVSNAQAYKQFGNAVCVPVVNLLAKEIIKVLSSCK
jgi:DNA (cytosine-5)-methyltransferase 1